MPTKDIVSLIVYKDINWKKSHLAVIILVCHTKTERHDASVTYRPYSSSLPILSHIHTCMSLHYSHIHCPLCMDWNHIHRHLFHWKKNTKWVNMNKDYEIRTFNYIWVQSPLWSRTHTCSAKNGPSSKHTFRDVKDVWHSMYYEPEAQEGIIQIKSPFDRTSTFIKIIMGTKPV